MHLSQRSSKIRPHRPATSETSIKAAVPCFGGIVDGAAPCAFGKEGSIRRPTSDLLNGTLWTVCPFDRATQVDIARDFFTGNDFNDFFRLAIPLMIRTSDPTGRYSQEIPPGQC